jgi:hypothetical protein
MSGGIIIHGEEDLQRRLSKNLGAPQAAKFFFDSWRFDTQRSWMANFTRGPGGWIWKGTTRQSITSEADTSAFPTWAKVGSNLDTARWGEFGTGLLSIDPDSAHRRYFPPPAALDAWAKDHGFASGYQVAFGIWKKGGTAPRGYGQKAVDASVGKIDGWLSSAAKMIEQIAPGL